MKTSKMKAVLIALDYNPTSQKVAELGYAVTKSMEAEVTLLHVLINPTLYLSASANMGAWQIKHYYGKRYRRSLAKNNHSDVYCSNKKTRLRLLYQMPISIHSLTSGETMSEIGKLDVKSYVLNEI